MASRGVSVEVVGAAELRRLARDLRRAGNGRELTKQLRKELRDVAKPLVPQIRSNIRGMPSKNQNAALGRKSLRSQLSRSVSLQVRTSGRGAGVAVFMNPRKMPDGRKGLPGYFERVPGKERLRHPVWGNADVRVNQLTPAAGYFTRATYGADRDMQRAARDVVDRIASQIEDA